MVRDADASAEVTSSRHRRDIEFDYELQQHLNLLKCRLGQRDCFIAQKIPLPSHL